MTAPESIALIRRVGGVAVLAHPFTLALDRRAERQFVTGLAELGLGGIEAYYSEHGPEQEKHYLALAHELGLAVSGGSDFHGTANPDIRLGTGFGNLRVPDEVVDSLYARAAQR